MSRSIFSKGDFVLYTSGKYAAGPSNPLVGTEFECKGVVHAVSGGAVKVEWENGYYNVYDQMDLVFYPISKARGGPLPKERRIPEPNMAFRFAKRMKKEGYI